MPNTNSTYGKMTFTAFVIFNQPTWVLDLNSNSPSVTLLADAEEVRFEGN